MSGILGDVPWECQGENATSGETDLMEAERGQEARRFAVLFDDLTWRRPKMSLMTVVSSSRDRAGHWLSGGSTASRTRPWIGSMEF
jgi:hypothetical protein